MPRKPKPKKVRASVAAIEASAVRPLPKVQTIPLAKLVPRYTRESNPNRMEDEKFALLKEAIQHEGFDQTILVTPIKDGTFRIEDGHHRFWAAQEAGLPELLAIVKPMSDHRGVLQGIGLNRLRGDLDLGTTAEVIKAVQDETQWELAQISLLTGFTSGELEALLSTISDPEQILDDVAGATPEEEPKADKPFMLEIQFTSRTDYKLARRKLRKAAGKGGDLALGLMNVLGEKLEAAQDAEDEESIHVEDA